MRFRPLLLAIAPALLFVAPAYAIKINDHALVTNGGSMGNVLGTAPFVFDALRTASRAAQFDAVGRIGNCTATWLGVEGHYAWVLTAARCVPNTNLVHAADALVFTNKDGVALAGGAGSTSYIHPNRITKPNSSVRDAGTDIALVRMKRLPASDAHAPIAAVLYDGVAETGAPVGFVSYGDVFAANRYINNVWPTSGERRAWGESMLTAVNEAGHALVSHFTTGSATNWAGVAATDAGSPWFQQRNGQWQIVGVTSDGTFLQSTGVRVSKYASWINDLFPGAQLASEPLQPMWPSINHVEVTQSKAYASSNFGLGVSFTKAGGQPNLAAPATPMSAAGENPTTANRIITIHLTNLRTGAVRPVALHAYRTNGCSTPRTMHNAVLCNYYDVSRFHVEYDAARNAGIPVGTWVGKMAVDATRWNSLQHRGRLDLDLRIDIAGSAPVFEFESANMATVAGSPNVYFTVPTQASASGPTSGHSSNTAGLHSTITVQARDAVTGMPATIKLRAQRSNGCAQVAMNNAFVCAGSGVSTLKVWFEAGDNPSLQQGRYRARFNVQARAWQGGVFNQSMAVDVDVNLLP